MMGAVRENLLHGPLLFPAALLVYYFVGWLLVGRKPRHRTIVPRYEPPEGISPAGARFLLTTGTDGRTVAATVADLAVRRCMPIVPESGRYRVTRLLSDANARKTLPPEEREVLSLLFYSGDWTTLDPADSGHTTLAQHVHRAVRGQFGDKYFTSHPGYILLGVLAGLLAALVALARIKTNDRLGALFLTFWMMFVAYVLGAIFWVNVVSTWKAALRGMSSWKLPAQSALVFAIFGAFLAFVGYKLSQSSSSAYAQMVVAIIVVNVGCAPLLKNYTALGQQALDEIEGFRQFLTKVEQDPLARLNAPNVTPQLLNEYLPFAIALEVKEAWGDHLCDAFLATGIQR
jgi:hypothetical protein